jgi:hypothetical protein
MKSHLSSSALSVPGHLRRIGGRSHFLRDIIRTRDAVGDGTCATRCKRAPAPLNPVGSPSRRLPY